ncbi:DUF2493 domain-containing protein [Novosphingobium resinovorum]|uniref:DUF2493 domain-containing protein n=1 Tax=Novosphingobium TaxID=165696 RepID=UPI001B3C68EA|nr:MULTISPECIES: DUF2493 domain-containing protein [Novosphingobium]MBF7013764.1 DUF2493 domain-containing protein [Novosphingobium sp. HR1a]WJM25905.1 DUF2493 domain-containing protein [Novosphingobium resinovorum]
MIRDHSRSISRFADLPALFAEVTATPEFIRAFGDPMPLSIVSLGEEPGEHDMPEPLHAQADCAGIIATIFDLLVDTRLDPFAPEIAWGMVNSFHFVAGKLERQEDMLAEELRDMIRRIEPSEVFAGELEEKQLLCQSLTEQREALECMRDYAAETFRVLSGRPWSPTRGSRVSKAATATQVSIRDFLRARELAERERYRPRGPIVVASGHAEWHDWQLVWDRLDAIRERIPHMTLVTTAQRKGFDAIVASWAGSREVQLVTYSLTGAGRGAPFARNRKLVDLQPVEAVLGEGSGIQANLYQALRKAGVPIHAFRKADQAPAGQVAILPRRRLHANA